MTGVKNKPCLFLTKCRAEIPVLVLPKLSTTALVSKTAFAYTSDVSTVSPDVSLGR